MARICLIILFHVLIGSKSFAESWIAIDGRAIKLTKGTKCEQIVVGAPYESCDCCLLKNTMALKMANQEARTSCLSSGLCPQDSSRSATRMLREARRRTSPFDIINIQKMPMTSGLPASGILDQDSVLNILVGLSQNGHLPLARRILQPTIRRSCFRVKALGNAAKGIHTGQIFAISVNQACLEERPSQAQAYWRSLYILKESKKGFAELHNLYKVRVSPLGDEYVPTARSLYDANQNPSTSIARMTFEDLHFKFDGHRKTRYFSLLQTAKGKSFQDLLAIFGKKMASPALLSEEKAREVVKARAMFYRVGFAMSKLHQKYARPDKGKSNKLGKTFIHGDFHAQNVFFDELSQDVTLIDNETFSLALKKRLSGVNDIVDLYLLHTVKTIAHQFSKQLMINPEMGIPDILWHDLWHDLFLGYLRAYDLSDEQAVQDAYWEFRAKFYEGLSNAQIFDSIKNFKDQRVLKRFGPSFRRFYVRERYLDRSFLKLQRSLGIQNLPRKRAVAI